MHWSGTTALVCFFLCFPRENHAGKILALLPSPMRSHQNVFHAVMNTLATRHNITLYAPPTKVLNSNITYKELKLDSHVQQVSKSLFLNNCDMIPSYRVVIRLGLTLDENYFETMLRGKDIHQLLKSEEQYDLIITTSFMSEHFFLLSKKFNAPIIMISPSFIMPWNNAQIGNPNFFSSDLDMVNQDPPITFMNRLVNFARQMYVSYHYNYRYLPMVNSICQRHYQNAPTIESTYKDVSLIFMNTNSAIGNPRPNLPNAVEIGGLHTHPSGPLSRELETFINEATAGVIYISLGGTIMGKDLPPGFKEAMIGALGKVPQRVLWKWEGEIEGLPSNVRVSKWFPQNDILGHENVRLFVTQGGILSFQEALYHGVPVLVIPLICDQYINAHLAVQHFYGHRLNLCDVTEENLVDNINEITTNGIYRKKTKEISTYLKSRSHTPVDRLHKWTNFVMKYRNNPVLKADSRNFTTVEQYQLDVYTAIVFCLLSFLFAAFYIIKSVCHFVMLTYEAVQNKPLDVNKMKKNK